MVSLNKSLCQAALTDAQAQRLLDSIERMTAAESLSDAALSDAAIHILVQMGEQDYAIINELISRFDKLAGIKRDEETGNIVQ